MPYTLWSRGQLLGSISALPAGVAVPGLAPGALVGFFEPTAAFATLAAPLATLASIPLRERLEAFAAVPRQSELANLPPVEMAGRVRAALEASADAQRFLALQKAIMDLALEIRDEAGAALAAPNISVLSLAAEGGKAFLDAMQEDANAAGEGLSEYLLVAQKVGMGTGAA